MKLNIHYLLLGLIMLIAVPNASAWLDHKTLNPENSYLGYPEIIHKDIIGQNIQSFELAAHDTYCTGHCSSILKTHLYFDGDLMQNIRFVDKNGKNLEGISFSITYSDGSTEILYDDVPIYSNVCEYNQTSKRIDCADRMTGYEKTERQELIWKEYKGEILPKGDYKLKIEGDLNGNKYVDWQIESNGIWNTEMSVWMATDFNAYWKMNEASGNALDSSGHSLTGTNDGGVTFIAGKLNNAAHHTQDKFTVGNFLNLGASYTIAFWYNTSTSAVYNNILGKGDGSHTGNWGVQLHNNNLAFRDDYNGIYILEDVASTNDGAWHHAVIMRNATKNYLYRDGVERVNAADTTAWNNAQNFYIGSADGSNKYTGDIDNLIIMNETAWNITQILADYNSGNGLEYQGLAPMNVSVILNAPENYLNTTLQTLIFNSTAVPTNGNITNATLYLWNTTGNEIATNFSIVSSLNSTNLSISGIAEGNYSWNVKYCIQNDSNALCLYGGGNYTFRIDLTPPSLTIAYPVQSAIYNMPPASIALNYTAVDTGVKNFSRCWYNMNNATNITINGCLNATVPLMAGLNNLTLWVNDTVGNTVSANRLYYGNPYFQICNATINAAVLNFTFKNEETLAVMNATVPSSTFTYHLNGLDASTARTYTFSNLTQNWDYSFCVFPSYANISNTFTFQFNHNGEATFPTRTYTDTLGLNNDTTNKTLYLLNSASGIYVSFLVVNSQLVQIPNTNILIKPHSSSNIIESVYTDGSGSASVWLNPSSSYDITFTASGYLPLTETLTPSQTQYTIQLGAVSGTNVTSYTNGLQYFILPLSNSLNYNTTYAFSFNISSSADIIQKFFFNISNGTDYFGSAYSANNGGLISKNLNTGDNSTFILYANWVINGNNFTALKFYTITNTSDYGYSINTFFTDLKSYKNSGLFGLNNFSMNLIIFIIIFALTGIMSYQFGLYSPAAVSGMIFALTGLFDMGLGLIANPVNAVNYFPTIFTGIIFVALMVREATTF